jgi:hypothetical protein
MDRLRSPREEAEDDLEEASPLTSSSEPAHPPAPRSSWRLQGVLAITVLASLGLALVVGWLRIPLDTTQLLVGHHSTRTESPRLASVELQS